MANTTWNPADKSANTTLSNGNLTATSSASGSNYVRAVDDKLAGAGKFYWEITATTAASGATVHGFCPVGLSNPSGVSFSSLCGCDRSGNIWLNTNFTSITLGSIVTKTIGIALDLTAKLAWFRIAPSGNWNASGTANPATGTGGVDVSLINGSSFPDAVPLATFGLSGDAATANFGNSAFSGAVPSGFTAGWTAASTSASLTYTEAPDAFAINIAAANPTTLAYAEPPDTAAITATDTLNVTIAYIEAPDAVAIVATDQLSAALSVTEAADAFAIQVGPGGDLIQVAYTEAADAFTINVVPVAPVSAVLAYADPPDTFAIYGPQGAPPLRERTYSRRPLGWSFDPSIEIVKDRPGPLRIIEFEGWMT